MAHRSPCRPTFLHEAGGGYAAYHETRALGLSGVFVARSRRYDDQKWRVRDQAPPTTPTELERAVARALADGSVLAPVSAAGAQQIAGSVVDALGPNAAVRRRLSSVSA